MEELSQEDHLRMLFISDSELMIGHNQYAAAEETDI